MQKTKTLNYHCGNQAHITVLTFCLFFERILKIPRNAQSLNNKIPGKHGGGSKINVTPLYSIMGNHDRCPPPLQKTFPKTKGGASVAQNELKKSEF